MATLAARLTPRVLLVTAGCLVLWRSLSQLPVLDTSGSFMLYRLGALGFGPSGFFPAIGANSLPFERFSVGDLGIGPYVACLVIMSVARSASARLRRIPLERWTVAIALLLSLAAAYGWTALNAPIGGTLPGRLDWPSRSAVCLELAGGTAFTIFLAHTLDEHGLGFGMGAFLLFALGPLADQVHRLADYLAILSVERLYAPVVIWALFSAGTATAAVWMLLAYRRFALRDGRSKNRTRSVDVRFVTPGVLRPTQFAFAVVSFPVLLSGYYPASSVMARLPYTWSPYSPMRWVGVLYVAAEATLIVSFAYFAAYCDRILQPPDRHVGPHVLRLAVVSGLFIAVLAVGAPIADRFATERAGQLIAMSGADVLLVVAVIFFIVRALGGRPGVPPLTASPSGVP